MFLSEFHVDDHHEEVSSLDSFLESEENQLTMLLHAFEYQLGSSLGFVLH